MDIDKYAAGVSKLLYGRIGAFPRREIHGDSRFKCTNGWFSAIYGKCASGKVAKILSNETLSFYDELERDFRETRKHDRLTTREDIIKGDKLLYMILQDCSLQKLKRGTL